MRPTDTARTGFTLIEVLVVIAIIAIVAAILFPLFAQSRANARKTACLSNCKQLGMAAIQYAADYDGSYPCSPYSAVIRNQKGYVWWSDMLFPYVRSAEFYRCPSDPQETDVKRLTDDPLDAGGGCLGGSRGVFTGVPRYVGYSANRTVFGGATSPTLPRPSETSVFFDSYVLCFGSPPSPGASAIARHGGKPRHQDGLNASYADGHARYQNARFSPSAVFQGLQGWWVVAGGPYDGRQNMVGTVIDDGTLGVP